MNIGFPVYETKSVAEFQVSVVCKEDVKLGQKV